MPTLCKWLHEIAWRCGVHHFVHGKFTRTWHTARDSTGVFFNCEYHLLTCSFWGKIRSQKNDLLYFVQIWVANNNYQLHPGKPPPKKGPFQKESSLSNHNFSGDMLNFPVSNVLCVSTSSSPTIHSGWGQPTASNVAYPSRNKGLLRPYVLGGVYVGGGVGWPAMNSTCYLNWFGKTEP